MSFIGSVAAHVPLELDPLPLEVLPPAGEPLVDPFEPLVAGDPLDAPEMEIAPPVPALPELVDVAPGPELALGPAAPVPVLLLPPPPHAAARAATGTARRQARRIQEVMDSSYRSCRKLPEEAPT
jgi:hypothetical protein